MLEIKEVITRNREIQLLVPPLPYYKTEITDVEQDLFWVKFPKNEGQVLILQQRQNIEIRVSTMFGLYGADTKLITVGSNPEKYYGLSIPKELINVQERQFVRVDCTSHVSFSADNVTTQTAMINFSEGGVMVYVTPSLEETLKKDQDVVVCFTIRENTFQTRARLSWRRSTDNVHYAGFEFIEIPPKERKKLAALTAATCQSE